MKKVEKKSFWKKLFTDPRGLSTGVKIVGGALAVAGAITAGKLENDANKKAATIMGNQTVAGTTAAGN
jgi:hypothetical protein